MADLTNTADVDHVWGGDIGLSPTGDLGAVIGVTKSQQRVLRRLQTASADGNGPADYLSHPDYGASIPRDVGSLVQPPALTAKVRGNMLAETSVIQDPAPVVSVTAVPNGQLVEISYEVAPDRTPAVAAFNASA